MCIQGEHAATINRNTFMDTRSVKLHLSLKKEPCLAHQICKRKQLLNMKKFKHTCVYVINIACVFDYVLFMYMHTYNINAEPIVFKCIASVNHTCAGKDTFFDID